MSKVQEIKVVRILRADFKATLRQIKKGQKVSLKIMVAEANALRVAASLLNKKGEGTFSVNITGDNVTVERL